MRKTAVDNSAAIPWTAQKIDPNGFWFTQRYLTETSDCKSSIFVTLTPDHQADGNFKKV